MSGSPLTPRLRAVVLGDTSAAPHHGCELVMTNLRAGLARVGIEIVFEHSGKGWQNDPEVAAALDSADLLVINGEGTMHHDRPQGYDFVEAAERVSKAGKSAFLVNCTWQQNSPVLAERARVFRRIHVRESQSATELSRAGIAAIVTPDLTFATDWAGGTESRRGWLVTDSTIPEVTLDLFRLSQRLHCDFVPVIAKEGAKLSLGRRVQRQCLGRMARVLYDWLRIPTRFVSLSHAVPNAREFLQRMSRRESMLTGRFHAVCFAILTGTPFLAMRSNSSKIESLLNDVGLSGSRMVERGVTVELIGDRLRQCLFSESEEQSRNQFVQSARSAIQEMFEAIQADAQNALGQ